MSMQPKHHLVNFYKLGVLRQPAAVGDIRLDS